MAYFFFRFTALEGLYFSIIFTDTDIYTDRQVVHVDLGLAGTPTVFFGRHGFISSYSWLSQLQVHFCFATIASSQ